MTPDQVARKIEQVVTSANARLNRNILRVQDVLYSKLLAILKKLDVSHGKILQTSANRKILRQAQNEFDGIIARSTYQQSINRYVAAINVIDNLNQDYFQAITSAFKPNKIFIRQLQAGVIDTVNTMLLQDGFVAQIKTPLGEILNQNVNSGGSFSGMLQQVRNYIKGTEKLDGRLTSYSRNILTDILFQYSRGYQKGVTNDLGLKWHKYVGGLIDDSREFCIDRAGKFFHDSEIRAWAALEWQGRNRYTTESSIFIYAGGYSCRHQIIPVSDAIVPAEDLQRFTSK